jgi:hypothetical protein
MCFVKTVQNKGVVVDADVDVARGREFMSIMMASVIEVTVLQHVVAASRLTGLTVNIWS